MKECLKCRTRKPLDEFQVRRARKDGRDVQCKECRREYATRRYHEKWKEDQGWVSKEHDRNRAMRDRKHEVNYEEQMRRQRHRCAICGVRWKQGMRRFSRDHCHATGRQRELLCGLCNAGLGCFRDDPARLGAAIEYLKRHAALAGSSL